MRGGTSKGVFFRLQDLPTIAQTAGKERDQILLRVIGSPDPYMKHTDGMGGATSSTSKVVIVSESKNKEYDVDYLFGQVAIDKPMIDWSGNCGNLSAAVGSFALQSGLIDEKEIPENGIKKVRIWQANIQKPIIAHIPIENGMVRELGDFELDGVTFPSAEIKVDFIDPVDAKDALFPTGNFIDELDIPSVGAIEATLINSGIPTIFIEAAAVGYLGTELQADINNDQNALQLFETIRVAGALKMGLIDSIEQAKHRQHTPKIAFVGQPMDYIASSSRPISKQDIDVNIRALSMGKLHHAMMGTAAVAIASAAAIPGTLVNRIAGYMAKDEICFGHPSGTLKVGAIVKNIDGKWNIQQVSMSRSARILMEGQVRVPLETQSF